MEETLKSLYNNTNYDDVKEEIATSELALKEISLREKGIILRAKSRWKVEGEKSSKYFCNLEKRNYTDKLVPKLILDDGQEIEDLQSIIIEQKIIMKLFIRLKTL